MRKMFIELMKIFNIGFDKLNKCFLGLERQVVEKDTLYVTENSGPIILANGYMIDVVAKRIKYLQNYKIFYKIYDHKRNYIKEVDVCRYISQPDLKKIADLIVRTEFGFWYTHSIIPGTNNFYEFLVAYDSGSVLYRMGTVNNDGTILWTPFNEFHIREKNVSSFHTIITENGTIIIYYRLGTEIMYYQVGKIIKNMIYFNNYYKFELPIFDSKLVLLRDNLVLCYSGYEYCFGFIDKNYDIKWNNEINSFEKGCVKELTYISDSDFLLKIDFENSIETYLIDYYFQKILHTQLKLNINSHFKQPRLIKLNNDAAFLFEVVKPNSRSSGTYNYSFDKISNICSNFILHRMNKCAL